MIKDFDPFHDDAVALVRHYAADGLGFNCTFVDDDMRVIVALAQRAVLAGLASDLTRDMQRRLSEASEKHRAEHEKALGYKIEPNAPKEKPADKAREEQSWNSDFPPVG